MKKITRFLCIFLLLYLCIVPVASIPASAVTFECDVTTYSESILMMNLDTDMEVYSKNPDEKQYPAALTKVMTYIIAAEYFDDFNQKIEIKKSLIDSVTNSGMLTSGLEWHTGKKLTVTDILYALMVPLGNDAAIVLADYIGAGKIADFVKMMNDKAQELGCENTHFANPTGVHDPNHYTTARDMYKITRYAVGLPMFSKICSTSTYYLEGDDYPIITTNYLIDSGRGGDYYYMYATGVKNGTTNEAGRCLAATARLDDEGYSYMIICLHAPYDENTGDLEQYCMIEAADLFRWAFLNLTFVTPVTKDTPICEQPVDHAWDTESILLVPESDLNIVLPANYKSSDLSIVPDNTSAVSAPINKGDVITTATVYYKDESFAKINLIAADSVGVSPILYTTDAVRSILISPWFLIAVGIIVVLFIVYVTVSSSYAKKKRRERKRK